MAGSRSIGLFDFTALKKAVLAGGAVGDFTVTGIDPDDQLVAVLHFQGDGSSITGLEDLTDEFSITDADTINNADGTATTNGTLLVLYVDKT
jgi:hypothetical protein